MITQEGIWENRYYMSHKIYMIVLGIWSYHSVGSRCLCFVPAFIFSSSIFIPQMRYLMIDWTDINNFLECLTSIMITTIFSSKLMNMMINNKKVKACLKTIEEDWLSLNVDIEKTILQKHTEYGRYLTMFYSIFMLTTTFFYLLKPTVIMILDHGAANVTKSLRAEASKLPFRVEYGDRLDHHLYPIIVHCYLAVFVHVFTTVAVDTYYTYYYALIQHACGMFSVIGFVELMESMFTNVFLISVTLHMIIGSICGIQVVLNLSNAKDIAAPLAGYFAQLIHLFLQFWQAQFLLDYSDIPYQSICIQNDTTHTLTFDSCSGKWYYTSGRCRKILLLIMSRSLSPCKLTAGKVVPLSIENFSAIK